jgi:hypothetical protein
VKRIAADIEEVMHKEARVRETVGVIASRVRHAAYFPNLVPEAQRVLRRWAAEFGPQDGEMDGKSGTTQP